MAVVAAIMANYKIGHNLKTKLDTQFFLDPYFQG